MRSFAGTLLEVSVGQESILLIDEPEAFLHPPQARMLGRMLVSNNLQRQIIVATHSGDVLRGVLDANAPTVRVVRMQRDDDINVIRELDSESLGKLWIDPLLRFSNILDSIFHERVVLAEADTDCRFYAAISDACSDENADQIRRPDTMFVHCNGKDRMPRVLRALRQIGLDVRVVVDFDVLNDENPLRGIVEAASGNWPDIEKEWRRVKAAVDEKKPELNSQEVRSEIEKELAHITELSFPVRARRAIEKILRRSSPWSLAKLVGKAYIPGGDAYQAVDRLLEALRRLRIFVVEVGELESFVKSVGNHGPAWVNTVLQKDLRTDEELSEARRFVALFAGPTSHRGEVAPPTS